MGKFKYRTKTEELLRDYIISNGYSPYQLGPKTLMAALEAIPKEYLRSKYIGAGIAFVGKELSLAQIVLIGDMNGVREEAIQEAARIWGGHFYREILEEQLALMEKDLEKLNNKGTKGAGKK